MKLPKRIRVQFKILVTGDITNVWQKSSMIIHHIIVADANIRSIETLIVELSLMVKLMPRSVIKSNSNRLEVGENDDEGTIKDLPIGAEKSDVQDQNLVPQNSVQRLAVLDDYPFPNQRSCNSADLQCQHLYAS